MISDLVIRGASVADAAIIARHRAAMFTDMGIVNTDALADTLLEASTSMIAIELSKKSYVGWLAIDSTHQVIAGAGVHFMPQLPRMSQDLKQVVIDSMPVVQNVYTEPAWRQRGVARHLMALIMQWAVDRGLDRLVLHASDAGRPLYTSLGFSPTREMGWANLRL